MSDGLGRKFVCHVYDENDLIPESVSQSMFDAPIEVASLEDEEFKYIEDKNSLIDGAVFADEEERDDTVQFVLTSNIDNYLDNDESEPPLPHDIFKEPITRALEHLKGYCSQLHLGWWSYEWCMSDKMTQFHIQVQSNGPEDVLSAKDLMPEFVVQSVSTIGNFKSRKILVESMDHNVVHDDDDEYYSDEDKEGIDLETIEAEVLVVDSFEDGEYCEEAETNRSVEVRMRCCTNEEIMKSIRESGGSLNNPNFFSKPFDTIDSAKAILLSVQERSTCKYTVNVCTNVLCNAWLEDEKASIYLGEVEEDSKDIIEFKRDDSIRFILDKTMKNSCLKRNEGWWTYNFCYQSSIYQFHESVDLDLDKGVMKTTVEAKHILGKFDPIIAEGFPNDEEVNHIVFPEGHMRDEQNNPAKQTESFEGLDNAYFVQEYTNGDVCEGEDVIDSAIKGGALNEGIVERSTTVRYFCGTKRELLKIYEDHTCHYVIDISVPELCSHIYFERSHIKKHAVKCTLV